MSRQQGALFTLYSRAQQLHFLCAVHSTAQQHMQPEPLRGSDFLERTQFMGTPIGMPVGTKRKSCDARRNKILASSFISIGSIPAAVGSPWQDSEHCSQHFSRAGKQFRGAIL
eukprot:365287-Chlamydomonas_euryale.AAC.7